MMKMVIQNKRRMRNLGNLARRAYRRIVADDDNVLSGSKKFNPQEIKVMVIDTTPGYAYFPALDAERPVEVKTVAVRDGAVLTKTYKIEREGVIAVPDETVYPVVDDGRFLTEMSVAYLRYLGYDARSAHTFNDAKQLIDGGLDLVVLGSAGESQTSDRLGEQVMRYITLRANSDDRPGLILSRLPARVAELLGIKYRDTDAFPGAAVVEKPYSPISLATFVRNAALQY